MADGAVAGAVAVEAGATKNGQRGRLAPRKIRAIGASLAIRSKIAPKRVPRTARANTIAVKQTATKSAARPIAAVNRAATKMMRARVGRAVGDAGDVVGVAKVAVKVRTKAVAKIGRERRDPKRATSRRPREWRTTIWTTTIFTTMKASPRVRTTRKISTMTCNRPRPRRAIFRIGAKSWESSSQATWRLEPVRLAVAAADSSAADDPAAGKATAVRATAMAAGVPKEAVIDRAAAIVVITNRRPAAAKRETSKQIRAKQDRAKQDRAKREAAERRVANRQAALRIPSSVALQNRLARLRLAAKQRLLKPQIESSATLRVRVNLLARFLGRRRGDAEEIASDAEPEVRNGRAVVVC